MNVHWCYSTPRLCCNYCCQISACSLSFKNQIFHMPDQSHLFQIAWNLCSGLWWKGCVQLRRGRSSSTRETRRANWWRGKAGWQIQVMAQPSSLLEKSKIKSPNCHTNFGEKKSWTPCNVIFCTFEWINCPKRAYCLRTPLDALYLPKLLRFQGVQLHNPQWGRWQP